MKRSLARLLSLALALLTCGAGASAETPPAGQGMSALGSVAQHLASQLAALERAGTLVVSAPLKAEDAVPRGTELAQRIATLVAAALGPRTSASTELLSLAAARSAARKSSTIVYLQAELARGELRVSGDAYRVPRNAWERVLETAATPVAHAFATSRIDAEVRSFMPPLPLLAAGVVHIGVDDRDIVALACGDAEGDGTVELLTVGRRRVALGRIRAGRFAPLKTALWSDLSPVAAAPLREPFAGAAIVAGAGNAPAASEVGITDRAHGARLDAELRALAPIAGIPVDTEGDTCASPARDTPRGLFLAPCEDPAHQAKGSATAADAVAIGRLTTREGETLLVRVTRDPSSGELTVTYPAGSNALPAAGAQLAIADLDEDGDPEIVSSLDVLDPALDALVVTSIHPGGAVRERLRLPVPTGIRAITTCPSEGAGGSIVLATGDGLWLVH